MGVFILYASLCAIIAQTRTEAPGTEVTIGYALLSGCWKLNPGQIKQFCTQMCDVISAQWQKPTD